MPSQAAAWSIKGVDPEVRAVARAAAARAGMTMGEWLDRAILQQAGTAGLAAPEPAPPAGEDATAALVAAELLAFEDRLDQTLRPVGLGLRDLAVRLVAVEQATAGPEPAAADAPAQVLPQAPDRALPPDPIAPVEDFHGDIPATEMPLPPPLVMAPAQPALPPPAGRPRPIATLTGRLGHRRRRRRARRLSALVVLLLLSALTAGFLFADRIGLGAEKQAFLQSVPSRVEAVRATMLAVIDDLRGRFADSPPAASPPAVPPPVAAASAPPAPAGSLAEPPARAATGGTGPVAAAQDMAAAAPEPPATAAASPPPMTEAVSAPAADRQASPPAGPAIAPRTVLPPPQPQPERAADPVTPAPAAQNPAVPPPPAAPSPGDAVTAAPAVPPSGDAVGETVAGAPPLAGPPPVSPADRHALQEAATQGDPDAQHDLGVLIARSARRPADYKEAARWFREAGFRSSANARYNHGVLLERGIGVSRNEARALIQYESAAKQSHPLAQYNTGLLYAQGRGVPANYPRAVLWFRAAADQGVASAFWHLARMTRNGLGVAADPAEASRLLDQARRLGGGDLDTGTKDLLLVTAAVLEPADREAVAEIQSLLAGAGQDAGPADGVIRPATKRAVRAWERSRGLPVTGVPSHDLLRRLRAGDGQTGG